MKHPFLPLVFLLLGTLLTQGEEIRRIGLDGTPGVAAPAQEDAKDGIDLIKKVDQASLEIFTNAKKPSRGTIMISPGGGYSVLAVSHEGRNVAQMLNEAGWDAAVLLYHVSAGPTTRELAIGDAKAALTLLQKRGAEFGLSTDRVGVLGFSAGGHLTARLAQQTPAANRPNFVVLIYPAYLEKDGKVLDEVAPTEAPTFLYVAANDQFAPSSVAYAAACDAMKTPHELHQPALGGHGFGLKPDMPDSVRDWPKKLKAFLEKQK